MHVRRFACFLLGAWLAASLLVLFVASRNRSSAHRALTNLTPEAAVQFKDIPRPHRQAMLAYLAAEQNRWLMTAWDSTQVVFGFSFLLFLLFGSRERKLVLGIAAWMLLAAFVQRVFLTPEIVALGRLTDFLPAGVQSGDRTKTWVLQNAYLGLEILKWLGGGVLMVKLLRQQPRRSDVRHQLNVVNKPDDRHVDG